MLSTTAASTEVLISAESISVEPPYTGTNRYFKFLIWLRRLKTGWMMHRMPWLCAKVPAGHWC